MSDTTGNMFNSCALPISSVEGLEDETSSLNVFFCSDDRSSPSKNTISERRRRRRLNESLYSLRAIVPIITKMDKASIIEDAINYIHQLQKQVKVAEEDEEDVVRLKENITPPCERECSHVESKGESMEELLEFDISEVKENVFSICLYCKGSPRLFVELDRVLESMEMLVTFANFNSFDGYILINIIVQKEDGEKLQVNVLKRVIAEVIK